MRGHFSFSEGIPFKIEPLLMAVLFFTIVGVIFLHITLFKANLFQVYFICLKNSFFGLILGYIVVSLSNRSPIQYFGAGYLMGAIFGEFINITTLTRSNWIYQSSLLLLYVSVFLLGFLWIHSKSAAEFYQILPGRVFLSCLVALNALLLMYDQILITPTTFNALNIFMVLALGLFVGMNVVFFFIEMLLLTPFSFDR